ncbi:carnitine O-acetyltransferase-like isoform X2 [Lycorma delicatula]|uniref:carnitine O-acetyltransferase-like isoform X2 n=1 Tax=Lycorma delicatula TaxID=130591 RepID=UPI003F5189CA
MNIFDTELNLRFFEKMSPYISSVFHFPARIVVRKLCSGSAPSLPRLPALPVPSLNETLTKYLKSVKPFLSTDEFTKTKNKVQNFCTPGGVGENLQKLLVKRGSEMDNWLEDWWLKTAYLEFRSPVVVHSSPGLVFPKQKFLNVEDVLSYTTKLISAAIDYKLKIDQKKIPLEKMGKNPLDMSQYERIFGTCRVPCIPCDKLVYSPHSKHIVVIHNNHFYKMNVLSECGTQFSDSQIMKALKEIISQTMDPAPAVGILTSAHRDKWAAAFNELKKDPCNAESVISIVTSLFTVSLDKNIDPCILKKINEKDVNDMTVAGFNTVVAGGPKANGGNRWYDKTIQFVIGEDGNNGLTYEHSPAEGQPIAVMMDHIVKYVESFQGWTVAQTDYSEPEELEFKLSSSLIEAIDEAEVELEELAMDFHAECFKFCGYGKDFIKKQNLSPDSYIQMALQYAFYRIHKEPGAHYESASTRMFIHGRTETIRSCSIESIRFCNTMLDGSVSNCEKAEALRIAVTAHKNYTLQALQGLGVDRHLLGLKMIALENKMPVPAIFDDLGFKKSTHMRISTSQVASQCDGFMVYGPLVDDGYACCYNPRANDINFGTSSVKSNPKTCTIKWKTAIIDSLEDMKCVLERAPQAKL